MCTKLWFAFKLVSLNHWKQLYGRKQHSCRVVICFQISIFEPLETTPFQKMTYHHTLWFAFKLVSLNHWKQLQKFIISVKDVVICFQISIFEPLETTWNLQHRASYALWFAFKLVSLNHWKQLCERSILTVIRCDLLSN